MQGRLSRTYFLWQLKSVISQWQAYFPKHVLPTHRPSPSTNAEPRSLRSALPFDTRAFGQTFFYAFLSIVVLYNGSPFTIRKINGASMSPTLSPDLIDDPVYGHKDRLIFRRMWPGRLTLEGHSNIEQHKPPGQKEKRPTENMTKTIKRGQLVLLNSPNEPNRLVVKRVVGLPGDIVEPLIRKEKLLRASKSRVEDAKLFSGCSPADGLDRPEAVTVPYGHIWVEGDNPSASYDSNDYGPVSQSLVTEVAYGYARLPWKAGEWRSSWTREYWENDDWEQRMGTISTDARSKSRLRKREDLPEWSGDEEPTEWRLFRQEDV